MAEEGESFSTMLRVALGDRLASDAAGFAEMLVDDAVMEFPYAPIGLSNRLLGRDAIVEHLTNLARLIAFDRIGAPVVHATGDPDVTILEFDGTGRGIDTGIPYEQRYISVIRTRGGRIVHYRDYWNPLAVLSAIKGTGIAEAIAVRGTVHG